MGTYWRHKGRENGNPMFKRGFLRHEEAHERTEIKLWRSWGGRETSTM